MEVRSNLVCIGNSLFRSQAIRNAGKRRSRLSSEPSNETVAGSDTSGQQNTEGEELEPQEPSAALAILNDLIAQLAIETDPQERQNLERLIHQLKIENDVWL